MLIAAADNALLVLAVLACPLGMILMMVFMGRGMRGMSHRHGGESQAESRSLAEMKAEQARLAEKIEALEARQPQEAVEDGSEREPDRVG